jgi:hypothetical protein
MPFDGIEIDWEPQRPNRVPKSIAVFLAATCGGGMAVSAFGMAAVSLCAGGALGTGCAAIFGVIGVAAPVAIYRGLTGKP